MGKTIGIDLGTTNSCMAILEGGEPTVIENAEGARTTPSVVAFTEGGERLVGAPARRQAVTNPENTVFSIKRFMGRKEAEVKEEETIVPFEVVRGPNGDARVKAGGKEYPPPEISAMILQKLKADAEAYLGDTVDSAVITVPAVLQRRPAPGHQGRRQDRRARRQAHHQRAHRGLARVRPRQGGRRTRRSSCSTSAAGTFDVSVLEIGDGVFEVKATAGDNHLGGDNFDKAIVDWLVSGVQEGRGRGPLAGQDGPPAPLSGGREGEGRAVVRTGDADQPAVHHGGRLGAQAPQPAPHPREAQRADRLPARPRGRADQAGHGGRRA